MCHTNVEGAVYVRKDTRGSVDLSQVVTERGVVKRMPAGVIGMQCVGTRFALEFGFVHGVSVEVSLPLLTQK